MPIGLMIRFANEEKMQEFINNQLSPLFGLNDLQVRPADSSDTKELFVLNRGRDGR